MDFSDKATILVVDDTSTNIDVLNNLLNETYKIKIATDGKKALAIAAKFQPDLILLDIMMPEMDGYEVCSRLKADPLTQNIPVIFLTALVDAADETRGFQLGAVDYITKPINPSVVLARVKTQLALYDQNRALENLVAARTEVLNETRLAIITSLCKAAEFKDNETGLHVVRMSLYSEALAKALGYDDQTAEWILNASAMHDVGKIGIPDEILLKPEKLNPSEWEAMKKHPEIGTEILGNHTSDLMVMAKSIALTHHEKWDGSGYPQGLKGDEIPIEGRLVAIADVFDALTSRRPYKNGWSFIKALQQLEKEKGKHFDPELVDLFLEISDQIKEIMEKNQEEEA